MISEFELIRRYFTHRSKGAVLGVGDDAAILRGRSGNELLVSVDMLVEGRHFFRGADPEWLGHKALAVNLSDMAAMGATPRWATLGLALPRPDVQWLAGFSHGFMRLARRHGVDLVGGDTTRGPLNICVQIMGEARRGRALRRDGARVGDDVWVSGELGDAALAVAALKGRFRLTPGELSHCERRLHRPRPRVELGRALSGIAHGAIDISDGLLADLGHVLERSRLAAEIHLDLIPVSRVLRRHLQRVVVLRAVLSGGDDYELCFTAPPAARAAVLRAGQRAGVRVTRIGAMHKMQRGLPRLLVRLQDGSVMKVAGAGGHDHFR